MKKLIKRKDKPQFLPYLKEGGLLAEDDEQ